MDVSFVAQQGVAVVPEVALIVIVFVFVAARVVKNSRRERKLRQRLFTHLQTQSSESEFTGSQLLRMAGRTLSPRIVLTTYAGLLRRAGWHPQSSAAELYLGVKVFGVVIAAGVFQTVAMPAPMNSIQFMICAVLLAWVLPDLILWRKIREYRAVIERDLPLWLDLHTTLVEGGIGFDEALGRICAESENFHYEIFRELQIVLTRINLGSTRAEALRTVAAPLEIESLDAVIAAIIQGEQTGSSIGETLRAQADMIRNKVWEDAQGEAQKLPTKLVFPIAIGVLPSLFLVTLGSSLLKLLELLNRA